MPQLIEKGYLYVAQPPLYKVKRGQNETYLKDDDALEQYLIAAALDEAHLLSDKGTKLEGEKLNELAQRAFTQAEAMESLSRRIPFTLIEAAVLVDLFNLSTAPEQAKTRAKAYEEALNRIASDDGGWRVDMNETGFVISRVVRGVAESYILDEKLFNSKEAKLLAKAQEDIDAFYGTGATFMRKAQEVRIHSPYSLKQLILEIGRKGISVQRFKGLGEMNPEQLWDTTLDPSNRTLLQIRVDDASDAEDAFSTLMGDVVEPRRDFIQQNALKVTNLDA